MNGTGRFALVRQLMASGINCMFGNPGSSEESILDVLRYEEFSSFQYYLAFQEGTAVAMADSYARATQRPAVVQLHSYAGLANGLGMMYYARRGYTPIVVFVGEAGLKYDALDGQMAADLVSMARPFVKADYNGPCAWRVVDPGSLLRLLRRALKSAATPPMGPVFLSFPMDILDLENVEPVSASSPVQSDVAPSQAIVDRAARLLAAAEVPIILAGDGVAACGAQAELTKVAELLGATVYGVNYSEVNMPASHPLYGGQTGHMFGADSQPITSSGDAVLICSTTVMPEVFPSLEGVFKKGAHLIHFDLNSYEIAKNFPVTIGALASPKPALGLLAQRLEALVGGEQRARARDRIQSQSRRKAAQYEKELAADVLHRDQVPLRASQFMEELGKRLPPGSLIFDEALTNSPELCRYLPQDEPGTFFQTRSGMLGTGLPGTVGLKIAHPEKIVVGFSGDGGSISTIQALATAARHSIGAKFVVLNNGSYRILKYNLQRYWQDQGEPIDQPFPKSFDLDGPQLRFDKFAEAQGVNSVRVTNSAQIGPALDSAFQDDKPFLIDLVVSGDL